MFATAVRDVSAPRPRPDKQLARELWSEREALDIGRERVARHLGISAKTLERWERAESHIGKEQQAKLRRFYTEQRQGHGIDVEVTSLDGDNVSRGTSTEPVIPADVQPVMSDSDDAAAREAEAELYLRQFRETVAHINVREHFADEHERERLMRHAAETARTALEIQHADETDLDALVDAVLATSLPKSWRLGTTVAPRATKRGRR